MKYLYELLVAGKQKALVGGLVSGGLMLLALVNISPDMTVREAVTVIATAIVSYASTYLTPNKGAK